jgi:hypothetical protein
VRQGPEHVRAADAMRSARQRLAQAHTAATRLEVRLGRDHPLCSAFRDCWVTLDSALALQESDYAQSRLKDAFAASYHAYVQFLDAAQAVVGVDPVSPGKIEGRTWDGEIEACVRSCFRWLGGVSAAAEHCGDGLGASAKVENAGLRRMRVRREAVDCARSRLRFVRSERLGKSSQGARLPA